MSKFNVGDIITRDGSDRQVVLSRTDDCHSVEVMCVEPPTTRWCDENDREYNLAARYHPVHDDRDTYMLYACIAGTPVFVLTHVDRLLEMYLTILYGDSKSADAAAQEEACEHLFNRDNWLPSFGQRFTWETKFEDGWVRAIKLPRDFSKLLLGHVSGGLIQTLDRTLPDMVSNELFTMPGGYVAISKPLDKVEVGVAVRAALRKLPVR